MSTRVAIVGANGFIGSRVRALFEESGWACDSYTSEYPIFDGETVNFRTGVPDVLVWAASRCTPKIANDSPEIADAELAEVRQTLSAVLLQAPRLRTIFLSSGGTVYGDQATAHREEETLAPLGNYGQLKSRLEEVFLASGGDPVILRVANAYGPGQTGAGAQGVLAVWMGAILNREPFRVLGSLDAARDYVYVDDVARAVFAVASEPSLGHRVFNVGSGVPTTLRELIEHLREVVGLRFEVEHDPSRGFDANVSYLDVGRIERELGWRAETMLPSGIAQMWQWMESHAADR